MSRRRDFRTVVLVVSAAVTLSGCASAIRGPGAVVAQPLAAAEVDHATLSAPAAGHPSKLLLVVLENHSEANALQAMPVLAAAARAHGLATDYRAITHPSLPNYLALIGGSTFGVTDDAGPAVHRIPGSSVLDAAVQAHHSARSYVESMPTACDLTSSGRYAVKHNPWAYFAAPASQARCRRFDVPAGTVRAGALHDDVRAGTLPTVGVLIPNLCNDGHDCPLGTADRWLAAWLQQLEHGPDWAAGRLAVVVTFDEDDYSGPNRVLTAVLAPGLHHVLVTGRLSHYSFTVYADQLAGVAVPRQLRSDRPLGAAFGLWGP